MWPEGGSMIEVDPIPIASEKCHGCCTLAVDRMGKLCLPLLLNRQQQEGAMGEERWVIAVRWGVILVLCIFWAAVYRMIF